MKFLLSIMSFVLLLAQLAIAQTVSINNLDNNYCVTAGPVLMSGTPAGGTFSGPGVSGNTFNPAAAGAGAHTIRYSVISNNIQLFTTKVVVVSNPPTTGIFGLAGPYCQTDNTPIAILGTPAGGSFATITGIQGAAPNQFFRPSVAGVGIHTITYSGNFGGCLYSTTTTVKVSASIPDAVKSISGFPRQQPNNPNSALQDVCASAPTIAMSGSPAGGTFSGTGVIGNIFNPSVAIGNGTSPQTFPITYKGTVDGCAHETIIQVKVIPTPNPTIAGAETSYCKYKGFDANGNKIPNSDVVTVTFSTGIQGVSGLAANNDRRVTIAPSTGLGQNVNIGAGTMTFKPSDAVPGTYIITYNGITGTSGDPNNPGCSFSTTFVITIADLANNEVSIQGLGQNYCTGVTPITLVTTPTGGTLAGPGVSGELFNPTAAGAGNHTITYAGNFNGCPYSTTKAVTVSDAPTPLISGLATDYCATDAAVNVTGTPPGGLFVGNGMTTNVFNPALAGAGTHIIEYSGVVQQSGCSYSSTVTVTVTPAPQPQIQGLANQYCITASPVQLTLNPIGGTLQGSGITNNIFNPAAAGAGTHNITYSGSVGACEYSTVVTVIVSANAQPSFDIKNGEAILTEFCVNGTPATFSLVGAPAGGQFSGPGVDGTSFKPADAGPGIHNITYAGESGGCTFTTTLSVLVRDKAAIFVTPAEPKICANQSVVLTASGGTNYTWTPGTGGSSQSITVSPTATTTYTVTGKDEFGCSGQATVTVQIIEPDGLASGTNVTVHNGTDGTATGVFTGLPAGTYTITLSSPNNTCTVTKTVVITEPECNNLIVDAGTDKSLCAGQSVSLLTTVNGGNGTYIYNWEPAIGLNSATVKTPTAQPSESTTYTLTVTDGNGCKAVDFVRVTVASLPTNTDQTYTICAGGSVQFNATGGASYVWSPNIGLSNPTIANPIASPNFTTVYAVTVNGANNCSSTSTVTVKVNPLPVITVTPTDVTCSTCVNGSLLAFVSGGTPPYQYSIDGINFQGTSLFNGLTPGDYIVYVVDALGCSRQSSEVNIGITIPDCSAPLDFAVTNISTSSAIFTWNSVANAIGYEVSYRKAGEVDFIVANTAATSFGVSNLSSGTTYEVRVRANCSNNNYSAFTGITQFITLNPTCEAPQAVSISSITSTSAVVSWTGVGNATSYIVEYRVQGSTLTTVITSAINTTTLNGLTPNTTYEVRVRTVCGSANNLSAFTNFGVFSTTVLGGCSVPEGFILSNVSQTTATVSWNPVASATSYVIRWKEQNSSSPFTNTVVNAPNTSFTFTNLSANTSYVVSVRTRCGGTNSAFSNEFVFKTLPVIGGRMAQPEPEAEPAVERDSEAAETTNSIRESNEVGELKLKVYPNPNTGKFSVFVDAKISGIGRLELADLIGRKVYGNDYLISVGLNELPIDISGNPTGVYFLNFKIGNISKTTRLVLR